MSSVDLGSIRLKVGDKVAIDGEVPGTVAGFWTWETPPTSKYGSDRRYVVVDVSPFHVQGTFYRIKPKKEVTVRLMLIHPSNLTLLKG